MRTLVLALALVACSGTKPAMRAPATTVPPAVPRLVVLLVIDQWPEWAFEQKRAAFHGGFARLLAEGDWHVGLYPTAATLTGPSHALLGTGEPPGRTGIIGDMWLHRDLGMALEAVHDADGSVTRKWLRGRGLGDMLEAHPGAHVVDVALKPRAAVLPIGHRGTSIWYDPTTVRWESFNHLPWLDAWNAAHPLSERLHEVWTPSSDVASLANAPDAQPGEVGSEGFGATFPHDPQNTKRPSKALLAMPLGDDVLFDLATRALDVEQLGRHDEPDLLVIGVSAHDYVGHGWGQESWEMWDLELRLDARLDAFLAELDRRVGPGRWAMVATSDHGASPLPETVSGGRITTQRLTEAANAAATKVVGPGAWIAAAEYPTLFFSDALRAQPPEMRRRVEDEIVDELRHLSGIERVGRVADLTGACETRSGDDRALCLMFDPERSGELFYTPKSGWIIEDENDPEATAHGSLHDYDRRVPLFVLAPGRTRHVASASPIAGEIDMLNVQPLLLQWLGIAMPGARP
jgi:hypothetical protein